MLQLAGK